MLLLLSALLFMSEPVAGDNTPGESSRHTAYTTWLQDDFIRVGIKKPTRILEMSAKGTLLVLDGKNVVGTIRPNGRFFVMANRTPATGSERWYCRRLPLACPWLRSRCECRYRAARRRPGRRPG